MSNPRTAELSYAPYSRLAKRRVLVELDKETKDKASFNKTVVRAVENTDTVRTLLSRVKLEVRDLDAYTEKAEVIEALKRKLHDVGDNFEVSQTNVNARGLRLALVKLDEQNATKLLKTAVINVWTSNIGLHNVKDPIDTISVSGAELNGISPMHVNRVRNVLSVSLLGRTESTFWVQESVEPSERP